MLHGRAAASGVLRDARRQCRLQRLLAIGAEFNGARLPVRNAGADERRLGVFGRLRCLRRDRRQAASAQDLHRRQGRPKRLRTVQSDRWRPARPAASGFPARA